MFRFELTTSYECAKCGRPREALDATLVVRGSRTLVVATSEPCPQCGGRRVVVKPRVTQGK